ncbi:GGDEF domain-containing protein [Azohydromonas aeria]|uniref:GGDEF domain-containing protein n=1 Tax=Azohydromonas aeria TaxID=2590212 RepID=UPI0012FA4916|nr:GGDEF domain-containing protein [Azohydromonas aeria]
MASLIDQLAELTGHRDRQHADALLLQTLHELLQPAVVALHRCAGEAPEQRWLTTTNGNSVVGPRTSDAAPSRNFTAPLDTYPERLTCLRQMRTVVHAGDPEITLVPLIVGAQGTGVVELQSPEPLPQYKRHTANAVVRLYGNFLALLDYGERDALTGLYNRKTFNDSFMRAVLGTAADSRSAGKASVPSSRYYLAALDLDHFKQVNDSCGHLIGDEVLLITARLMRTELRTDDGVFRFGGEEFLILLEAHREEDAHAALQRLRQRIAQHHYPQVGQVTASIGFTAVQPSELPTSAVERADRALYQAKASGRNCVVGPAAMAEARMAESSTRGGDVDLF